MSLRVSTSSRLISACSGLMYSGVPISCAKPVNSVFSVSCWPDRLGHAEVDHLGHRRAVVQRDQDVGGLEVAVDDPFLMGVLHGLADRHEQLEPLARSKGCSSVAELGDRDAADQLHDEVGTARLRWCRRRAPGRYWGGPSGPGPAARPRSGRRPARVHARLDDLQGDLAADGLLSARPCRRRPCRLRRSAPAACRGR